MGRRGRSSRSVKRGPKNQLWTAAVIDDFTLTTGLTSPVFQVVIPTDWQRSSVAMERATLMRIRGWITVSALVPASGTLVNGTVFMYCAKFDEDESAPSGGISATYADEDVFFTAGAFFGSHQRIITVEGGGDVVDPVVPLVIDIKAMRKITTGSAIDFVFTNNLTTSVVISGVLRGLVRLGGN